MEKVDSKVNLSAASDIIAALRIILRSQVITPDLETQYSRTCFPNTYHPVTNESISAVVTERQEQLDSVLREISGLETVMDDIKNLHQQLVKQKDNIIQSMTFHKGIGSALWRLPSETLSQIFYDCLPEDEYLLSPASRQAPMLLTRICRPWREVAVGMPSLWCRLHVRIDVKRAWQPEYEYEEDEVDWSDWEEPDAEASNSDWQRAAFCYDSWLKRSRGRPLSLVLECYHSIMLLRGLLQPYINQISTLSIHFRRGARRTQLLLEDVPALHELVLVGMNYSELQTITQSISQLPSTMRSLDIMALGSDIPLNSVSPVWANLTHVAITLCHPDAFFRLLHLCPNLCSLTVRACFYSQQTLGPFTHTNIQSLYIIDTPNIRCHLSRLFNALSLPKLCKFEALLAYEYRPWPHEELKDLLVRSKCPLECLTFSGQVTVTDVPRAEYVALIPSLDVVVYPTDL
ncbi:hypothetical protein EDB19DRAFT_1909258 [Suillus lakei]|nr:hypothetical protein EDB19DRAFT_1909258 [Suillus lakei]